MKIEKLETYVKKTYVQDMRLATAISALDETQNKLNEIIDALNSLQGEK